MAILQNLWIMLIIEICHTRLQGIGFHLDGLKTVEVVWEFNFYQLQSRIPNKTSDVIKTMKTYNKFKPIQHRLLDSLVVECWLRVESPAIGSLFLKITKINDTKKRLLDSPVVECWLWVREVPGSIPSQGPRHTKDVLKMVPVALLFSTEH